MDTGKIARELRSAITALQGERTSIDDKIKAMELALRELGVKRGPGRPKGSTVKKTSATATRQKVTRNWTPEAREAARQRMKRYWANRKKKAAKKA